MIYNWRHIANSDFDTAYRSAWQCLVIAKKDVDLDHWFRDQGAKDKVDYEVDFRFNSGNPGYFISIYKESLATAFLLRWK